MTIITHHTPTSYSPTPPKEADVVVIGAGIIGITSAWFLADRGLKVVVCEKGRVAGEQSSRNWGWIRQQGRDQAELPIMMESMRIWAEFSRQFGPDIGFTQGGSLYLCEEQSQLDSYNEFLEFAADYNLDSQQLNREQLYKLLQNTSQHWNSALYTPSDARAEPTSAVPTIARACADAGVTIIENCAVDQLSVTNHCIDGVDTEQGHIKCARVLCCAGHWSAKLLQGVGIALPQLSVKASVVRTAPAPLIFNGNASGSNIAFRRRQDGGYTIAMTDYLEVFPSVQGLKQLSRFLPLLRIASKKLRLRIYDKSAHINPFSEDADFRKLDANRVLNPKPSTATLERMRRNFDKKIPVFRDLAFIESWSGMIDAMPDAVPVIDAINSTEGLFVATGFSGHGFGIGPAAGKIMANLIQGENCGHDISRFRFSRFSDASELVLGPSI